VTDYNRELATAYSEGRLSTSISTAPATHFQNARLAEKVQGNCKVIVPPPSTHSS
jgi:hypothetical protein